MSESDIAKLYGELKEIRAEIKNLSEAFNRAAYGDGFPRCTRNTNRIDHLEESVDLCHSRISGVKKWLVAGLVSVASMLANFAWNMFQSSVKH